MAQNHRQSVITTKNLLFAVILLTSSIQLAHCGCRMQDRNPCEKVCQWNATRNDYDCVLRVIVILPKKDSVEASLPRVINNNNNYNVTFCLLYNDIICGSTHKTNHFQIPHFPVSLWKMVFLYAGNIDFVF